jgi:hypothetical protein
MPARYRRTSHMCVGISTRDSARARTGMLDHIANIKSRPPTAFLGEVDSV